MKFTAAITFEFESNSSADAFDLAASAAEHLLDTFNDDGSINPLVWIEVKPSTTVEDQG